MIEFLKDSMGATYFEDFISKKIALWINVIWLSLSFSDERSTK